MMKKLYIYLLAAEEGITVNVAIIAVVQRIFVVVFI